MDLNLAPNPTIPTAPVLPRTLPEPSSSQRSHALTVISAERARAFGWSLLFVFGPLALAEGSLRLGYQDGRTAAFGLAGILFLRLVTLKAAALSLQRWGNILCFFLLALFALGTFPSRPTEAEKALHSLLISVVLAAAFLPHTRWFVASAVLCSALYFVAGSQLLLRLGITRWFELALTLIISTLVHATQARLCRAYNKLSLTDEARFQIYTEAAESARKSQHRFEKLSDASKEAIVLHAEGTVVDANMAAQELLKLPRESLLGRPVTDVLSRASARFVSQLSDPRNPALSRIKVVRGDGSTIEAMGYNKEIVFSDGTISVLGLRPLERKTESEEHPRGCADDPFLN